MANGHCWVVGIHRATSIDASMGGNVTAYGAGCSGADAFTLKLRAPGQEGGQQLAATHESSVPQFLPIVAVPPWKESPALTQVPPSPPHISVPTEHLMRQQARGTFGWKASY